MADKSLAERLVANADYMKDMDTDYNQSEPLLREAAAAILSIEKVLLRDSAATDKDGNIRKDHFVGQAVLLCRSPKPVEE